MNYVLVLEDHPLQRQRLVVLLKRLSNKISVLESDSIEGAYQIAKNHPIDLFYIDIGLKDGSGIEFAQEIRKNIKYEFAWIVFITAYDQHMLEAFKGIHCYDYLIKPYEDAEVEKLTHKLLFCSKNKKAENESMTFEIESMFIRFDVGDIYFIEALGKNCLMHTIHGQYLIKRMSLKSILNMTNSNNMVQVHRAYIINPQRIRKVDCRFGAWTIHFTGYEKFAMVGFTFQNKMKTYLLQTKEA